MDPAPTASVFIYALVDPRDNTVRYVGKANNPRARLRAHRNERASTRKARWIAKLKTLGLVPELVVLEAVPCTVWQDAERKWIHHFHEGLFNHTEGGEGLHGASQETREKLRAIQLRAWSDPAFRQKKLLELRSPERRAKLSLANRGVKKTREHIAKLPQNQKGRKLSPEKADRQRAILRVVGYKWPKGLRPSEKTRKAIANKLMGNQHTKGRLMPEHEKRQRSIALIGKRVSPETRERIREAALRRWAKAKGDANDTL